MVYGNHPTDDCRCDNKEPSVFVFSEYPNGERNKKREHSNTLIPTEVTWFESHNLTDIHTTEKCHDSLNEGKVECVVDNELFCGLEHVIGWYCYAKICTLYGF